MSHSVWSLHGLGPDAGESAWAAVTRDCRPGGSNNRNSVSPVSEGS